MKPTTVPTVTVEQSLHTYRTYVVVTINHRERRFITWSSTVVDIPLTAVCHRLTWVSTARRSAADCWRATAGRA